jgi:hypothetical protein
MGRLIVAIAIVAGVMYGWNKGWFDEWLGKAGERAGKAVDNAAQGMRGTQREATKVRPADAPEEKK